VTADRVTLNTAGNWLGPDYALGLVDEIVVSDALVHLEMMDDSSAYLAVYRCGDGEAVSARIHARPTTRAERQQVLAHGDNRLYDHLASLIPQRWGGRSMWSIPWWRRPAAAVRDWRWARRAAGAVLEVRVEDCDLIGEQP
jgi:hypothetical protein